jgi:hypothetical protein
MPESSSQIEPYAAAIRKLLKGVIYHDDPVWMQIRDYQLPIREYLGKIGLALYLDEIGNFAYLRDMSRDDDNQSTLPALTIRRNLSFPDTLLLVLLRERLDEHEMRDLDGSKLILSLDELKEMIVVFMVDHPDAQKIEQNTESSIRRLMRYGFLTERRDGRFEVRPLLRAKIGADELEGIKSRLIGFLQRNNDTGDDGGEPV